MSLFDRIQGRPQVTMQQICQDPVGVGREAGYNVPPNLASDPEAMVMHLINSGQVSNPMLQKIMPMIQRLRK